MEQFEHDVFVSYVWEDDKPSPTKLGQIGRISEIVSLIDYYKGGKYREFRIFKDKRLPGNEDFNAIISAVKKSALFLAFVSPNYVNLKKKPNWCQIEAEEFYKHAQHTIGEKIGEKWRVFRILVSPVEELHPPYFRNSVNRDKYELFTRDNNGEIIELHTELGGNIAAELYRKILLLTVDIIDTLKLMESRLDSVQDQLISAPQQPTVYLAQTTADLDREYDSLKYELKQRGYTVLPDSNLLDVYPLVEQEVNQCLERSQLSIQLIGERYGQRPDESEHSVPVIQHHLISKYCQSNPNLARLIWMPPTLNSENLENSRQKQFIQMLQNSLDHSTPQIDLLKTPFENFKQLVTQRLEILSNPDSSIEIKQKNSTGELSVPWVYLLYDKLDQDHIGFLRERLNQAGRLELVELDFDTNESISMREFHEQALVQCDAVLIYWGNTQKIWLETKKLELKKFTPDRSKPFRVKGIFVGDPPKPEKESYNSSEFCIIQGLDDIFDQFLAQLLGG